MDEWIGFEPRGAPPSKPRKKRKGLAAMSKEKRSAIGKKGNRALRDQGKVHEFSSDEARTAQRRSKHPEEKILETLQEHPNQRLDREAWEQMLRGED